MERVMGIEPTTSAWKAEVLPLNYTRILFVIENLFFHSRACHASSSTSLLEADGCVEATRSLFIGASLVAEVLPLNYTRTFLIWGD
jgi:hypothetical protein